MSAETVYGGGPQAPELGTPQDGTLPVTGFEVVALFLIAAVVAAVALYFNRKGSK
jgi:hypothetical protein